MLNQGDEEIPMHSHEDVEEVFSIRKTTFGKSIGEVAHEGPVLLHVLPHVDHRELVVHRYTHTSDICQFEKYFLTT